MNAEERKQSLEDGRTVAKQLEPDEKGYVRIKHARLIEVFDLGIKAEEDVVKLTEDLVAEGEEVDRLSSELDGSEEE